MPSYTSSSKYKRRVLLFFVSILLLFMFTDFVIYKHFFGRTTASWYINNMPSKEKHMALNLKNKPPRDAIFIGNSRTLFQISTQEMSKHGISIYNLGVSGHDLPDYPSMIGNALKYHPKSIVLCLSVGTFYAPFFIPKDVDLLDLRAYRSAGLNKSVIFEALLQYLRHWVLVDTYSTNLNLRARTTYAAFNKFYGHFTLSKLQNSFKNPMFLKKSNPFDPNLVPCDLFRIAHPKYINAVGMCTNGDGVLSGVVSKKDSEHDAHRVKATSVRLDVQSLKLFDYLIQKIKNAGVQPIVIFTPIFHAHYSPGYIKKNVDQIHAPVIDMTNLKLDDALWADQGHLNYKGRAVYTRDVAKALSPYFQH